MTNFFFVRSEADEDSVFLAKPGKLLTSESLAIGPRQTWDYLVSEAASLGWTAHAADMHQEFPVGDRHLLLTVIPADDSQRLSVALRKAADSPKNREYREAMLNIASYISEGDCAVIETVELLATLIRASWVKAGRPCAENN